jgi:hypothetical protein
MLGVKRLINIKQKGCVFDGDKNSYTLSEVNLSSYNRDPEQRLLSDEVRIGLKEPTYFIFMYSGDLHCPKSHYVVWSVRASPMLVVDTHNRDII